MLNSIRIFAYILPTILIITIINLQGCDFSDIKPKSTTGDLKVVADENIKQLMIAEEKEFERLNPEANIEYQFMATREVTAALINGDVSVAVVVGGLTEEEFNIANEHNVKIDSFAIAVDGVGFIVNPENPIERVTSEDLKKIFTGKVNQWSQVKTQDEEQNTQIMSKMTGKNSSIKIFVPNLRSDFYTYIRDTLLNGEDYSSRVIICKTGGEIVDSVRKYENAIGISNLGWLGTGNQDILDSTVKTLRVSRIFTNGFQDDFRQFHNGLVFNSEYSFRRVVYAFSTEQGIKLSTGFITFLTNKDGQKVVLKEGMVPVTQPVRTVQIN